MLLKWDLESPVKFRTRETVHELDLRFQFEEQYVLQGKSITDKQFYKDLHGYIERKVKNESWEEYGRLC